jgi:hypothetical protein
MIPISKQPKQNQTEIQTSTTRGKHEEEHILNKTPAKIIEPETGALLHAL